MEVESIGGGKSQAITFVSANSVGDRAKDWSDHRRDERPTRRLAREGTTDQATDKNLADDRRQREIHVHGSEGAVVIVFSAFSPRRILQYPTFTSIHTSPLPRNWHTRITRSVS